MSLIYLTAVGSRSQSGAGTAVSGYTNDSGGALSLNNRIPAGARLLLIIYAHKRNADAVPVVVPTVGDSPEGPWEELVSLADASKLGTDRVAMWIGATTASVEYAYDTFTGTISNDGSTRYSYSLVYVADEELPLVAVIGGSKAAPFGGDISQLATNSGLLHGVPLALATPPNPDSAVILFAHNSAGFINTSVHQPEWFVGQSAYGFSGSEFWGWGGGSSGPYAEANLGTSTAAAQQTYDFHASDLAENSPINGVAAIFEFAPPDIPVDTPPAHVVPMRLNLRDLPYTLTTADIEE